MSFYLIDSAKVRQFWEIGKYLAVWEIFGGLLSEVVATGTGICDKGLMRGLNRVAKLFTICHWPTPFSYS